VFWSFNERCDKHVLPHYVSTSTASEGKEKYGLREERNFQSKTRNVKNTYGQIKNFSVQADIIAVQFNSGGETTTLERASTLKNAYVPRAKRCFYNMDEITGHRLGG
jgi:hypothetical protein